MTQLREIQKKFGQAVRGIDMKDFSNQILPGGRLNSEECVRVYRDGYTARLTSSLGETFETVWRILGDDEFFSASLKFIKENDSESYNLSDYGNQFPEFLRKHYPQHPYLESTGRFELLFKETFHSENGENIDFLTVDLSQPEKIVFKFLPSVRLLKSGHRVFDLWDSRHHENFQLPDKADLYFPEIYLLFKKEMDIYCEILTQDEFEILENLINGKTILHSLSNLSNCDLDEMSVSEIFRKIVNFGIVTAAEKISS
ncbi:MAG: DNA-binding domain-containing protein [Spirochaetia bacterium]|nr:DNA-binding domain-containing protein [Spirochaetia bacterium]